MVSNDVANVAISSRCLAEMTQRTKVVLIDPDWFPCDVERYVGRLVLDDESSMPMLVVGQRRHWFVRLPESATMIVVPDIERVAAAFGIYTLPAVVISGTQRETMRRIETIVQWQQGFDADRASGAISANELH